MKTQLLVTSLVLMNTVALAGTGTHGGDEDRELVLRIWRTTAAHVERYQNRFPEVDATALSQRIENGPRPEITSRRLNCDAIRNSMACYNDVTGTVTFNRERFHPADLEEKLRISVHELFRTVSVDDGYNISQRLFGLVPPEAYFDLSTQFCPRGRDLCVFERTFDYSISGSQPTGIVLLPDQRLSIESLEYNVVVTRVDSGYIYDPCQNAATFETASHPGLYYAVLRSEASVADMSQDSGYFGAIFTTHRTGAYQNNPNCTVQGTARLKFTVFNSATGE